MFLDDLKERVLIFDGAMGTMVQNLKLSSDAFGGEAFTMFPDIVSFSHPGKIRAIHLEYLKAGADIIETNTFGSSPLRLSEFDFSLLQSGCFETFGKVDLRKSDYNELSRIFSLSGAQIAMEAVHEYKKSPQYDGRPVYVAGSVGPSNCFLAPVRAEVRKADFDTLEDNFYTQALALLRAGVDILLFETQQDPLEMKAAIIGAKRAVLQKKLQVPLIVSVAVDRTSRMPIFGTDLHAAYVTVQGMGIDVFGINCVTGPHEMEKSVKRLGEFSHHPFSVFPNAGEPTAIGSEVVFNLEPRVLADFALRFVEDYGASIVGGCCGTMPAHIHAISSKVRNRRSKQRVFRKTTYVSGPREAISLDASQGLIKIGERLNVRGSRKVRNAVEKTGQIDIDVLTEIAREQVHDLGLSILDLCMDSGVVNTEDVISHVIYNLTADFDGALCIDSFSPEVFEKALKVYPGRPIVNSISLEEISPGITGLDLTLQKTKAHGPVYIALTTGSDGPATRAREKKKIAAEIVRRCERDYGVKAESIIVDIGAYPIGSEQEDGANFALESLNAIPLIKGIHTDLKVSVGAGNLTSGLSKKPFVRKAITSVFLDVAISRGLDVAIVNPDHFVPVSSLSARVVHLARRVILEHDMDAFLELEGYGGEGVRKKKKEKTDFTGLTPAEKVCRLLSDGFRQRVSGSLRIGKKSFEYTDRIVEDISEAIREHPPEGFIDSFLIRTITDLGDAFGRGEVSLPHLLRSADLMKHSMAFLEAVLEARSDGVEKVRVNRKGVVVLGTVYQDVHSIGKDLAATLLAGYGYRVVNLGVQVRHSEFIRAVQKENAVAIGLSALLVQTAKHMITISKMLQDEGISIPILVGGAAVNQRHAAMVAMAFDDRVENLNPGVFYCRTAMDAVKYLDSYADREKRASILDLNRESLVRSYKRAFLKAPEVGGEVRWRSVSHDYSRPKISEYGVFDFPVNREAVSRCIDVKKLFLVNWKTFHKFKGNEEKAGHQPEKWLRDSFDNRWIRPACRFGFFPANSDGERLVVFDPEGSGRVVGSFHFDISTSGGERWCVSQYFLPRESKKEDIVGLLISTAGIDTGRVEKFKAQGDIERAFLLQGLADRIAEDAAGLAHNHMRELSGCALSQGARISPGYPLMKDLCGNRLIFNLMRAGDLGISMTEACEFQPTCTTASIIGFHPDLHIQGVSGIK